MDEYEDEPGQPAKDKCIFGYGQVQLYAYITLIAHPSLRMATDLTEILAITSLCHTNWEDATKGPVWYDKKNMGSLRAFSVTKPTHFFLFSTIYSYSTNLPNHFGYHIVFLCYHVTRSLYQAPSQTPLSNT